MAGRPTPRGGVVLRHQRHQRARHPGTRGGGRAGRRTGAGGIDGPGDLGGVRAQPRRPRRAGREPARARAPAAGQRRRGRGSLPRRHPDQVRAPGRRGWAGLRATARWAGGTGHRRAVRARRAGRGDTRQDRLRLPRAGRAVGGHGRPAAGDQRGVRRDRGRVRGGDRTARGLAGARRAPGRPWRGRLGPSRRGAAGAVHHDGRARPAVAVLRRPPRRGHRPLTG